MADIKNNIKSGIDDAARAAKGMTEQGAGVAGTIRDTAQRFAERAGDMVGHARDRIGDWAGSVNAENVQQFAHDAYDAVGEKASNLGREVATLVRRHPLPAILVGFGVGLLLGRAVRSV